MSQIAFPGLEDGPETKSDFFFLMEALIYNRLSLYLMKMLLAG